MVHEFWTEDRVVRATSTNSYFEARVFKGSDLNPFMDFRVESESVAPRSKAAKQAFITELMKTGALPMDKAMRYLQMNESNKLYEELMVDSRHAQRENYMMSKGQPLVKNTAELDPNDPMGETYIPRQEPMKDEQGKDIKGQMKIVTTNDFDNHPIHILEHENYMKSQEYELLTPDIQIFLDHLQEHKEEIMLEQIAQQELGIVPAEQPSGNGQSAQQPAYQGSSNGA